MSSPARPARSSASTRTSRTWSTASDSWRPTACVSWRWAPSAGAGGGCLCPENTTLAQAIRAVGLRPGEAIVLDTQAGVEHFGRAIARGFGHAVIVTDPTYSGIGVAVSAGRLARDLGIPSVHLVVNRVRDDADRERVADDLERRGDGLRFDTLDLAPLRRGRPGSRARRRSPACRPRLTIHDRRPRPGGRRLAHPDGDRPMKVVIIGSGPAGIVAAETLRAKDPTVELEMITQEPYPPYSPPAMADHFLNGRDEPLFWRGRDVTERLGIDLPHVVARDRHRRRVRGTSSWLASGVSLRRAADRQRLAPPRAGRGRGAGRRPRLQVARRRRGDHGPGPARRGDDGA